jgi:hypothetical protein
MHKHVGNLLTELFPNYQVRQEYPVNQVNPSFASGREKFDWVVLGLNIVVEVHGEHHFRPVYFGGVTGEEAKRNYRKRMEADWEKQEAAEKAGWAYLVVKYDEKKITAEELSQRVSEAVEASQPAEEIVPAKPKAKIPHPREYKWPTRKIPSRKFG